MKKRSLKAVLFTGIIALTMTLAGCGDSKITGDRVSFETPMGFVEFGVDIVKSEVDVEKGLGGVASLAANHGMLFWFDNAEIRHFWMKDMKIPLDIVFVGPDYKVVHILKDMQPCTAGDERCPSYSSMEPTLYVVEINAGLTDKYNIAVGSTMEVLH